MPYEERLRVFRQQGLRRRIDSRLDLAQRHRLSEWGSDSERAAYELILQLQADTNSPLCGQIILKETVKRPYEHRHRPEGINAAGLWATLKSVMSKSSPLHTLSLDKRAEVASNLIRVASETWPSAWGSTKHILTTARGINAILKLMVSGADFRGVIGDDFRIESLQRAFEYAKTFNWTRDRWKNAGVGEITDELNKAIARGRSRDTTAVVA
jgi:hypothetical protein